MRPGGTEFKAYFFDWGLYRESFPEIADAFWVNVKLFLIAEAFILPAALLLAVLRSLPGPVFFPIRALAVVYADLFRGIPTILVVMMLGFGMPALGTRRRARSRRSSGPWSRSCSSTRPTSRRSTAPGSSRCTRARRPRLARSA